MAAVSVHEAKALLSSLIAKVEDRHEQVIICRYGRAVARLEPISRGRRTVKDPVLSQVIVHWLTSACCMSVQHAPLGQFLEEAL